MGASPTVHLFTYKQGLLSALAHDLQLRAEAFRIELAAGSVAATFAPERIRVMGVRERGQLRTDVLSERDRTQIETVIRDEILRPARHGAVRFAGVAEPSSSGGRVSGTLTLAGNAQPLTATVELAGDRLQLRVTLQPSRHGIAPYRALAGALRLQDRVDVELQLPADVPGFVHPELAQARCVWESS